MSYQISKLSADSLSALTNMATQGIGKSNKVSIALAYALAYTVNIPSAPVENLSGYFKLNSVGEVDEVLSRLNEVLVVDVEQVEQLTEAFYKFRYSSVFGDNVLLCLDDSTGVVNFFRVNRFISPETIKVIAEEGRSICELYNMFTRMLDELKKA